MYHKLNTKQLLKYSIENNLRHIPSALSQFSYLKYLLPKFDYKNTNIVIGKPFGSQAYYMIWKELGLITNQKLSYGVKHDELDFVNYSEETLGNALGIGAGIALGSPDKLTYVNLSDGALQMGPTLEAIQFIGKHQLNMLITIDFNGMQLTDTIQNVSGINCFNIEAMFRMYDIETHFYDTKVLNDYGMNLVIDNTLQDQKEIKKPIVVIFKTSKGQGVKEMEDDSVLWHYKELTDINEITINS
jgi:transketolase N-terminal domain/subunit